MSVKKRLNKIVRDRVFKTIFLVLLTTVFSFLVADAVFAQNAFVRIVGGFIAAITYVFGWILMLVVRVLVYVAQYNNFIDARPIQVGWIMVRDLANMFFIVILLIIAFATILRIEKYNYKKWLPKLLLMAVLINFSRTICGLMIDVAQVVMLSFVNSFKDIGNYNFTNLLGIGRYGQFKGIDASDSNWDILAAYGLMLIYTVISLVVMIAMTAMLVMRIIMIWVYVVLSPLAFLLGSFPDGQSHAGKWWSQFGQNLVIGPVLAFFIWLSFMTVDPDSDGYKILEVKNQTLEGPTEGQTIDYDEEAKTEIAGVGQADTLLRFIVAIAMLLGGLKIAQDIGGQAGTVLGKVSQKGFSIAKHVGKKAASGDHWAARKVSKGIGFDLRPIAIQNAIKSSFQESKRKDEMNIQEQGEKNLKAGGYKSVLGGVGAGQDWGDAYWSYKGAGRAAKELTVRPFKRKAIKREMEEEEEKNKKLDEQFKTSYSRSNFDEQVKAVSEERKSIEDNYIAKTDVLNYEKLSTQEEYNKKKSKIEDDERKGLTISPKDKVELKNLELKLNNFVKLEKDLVKEKDSQLKEVETKEKTLKTAETENKVYSDNDYKAKKEEVLKSDSNLADLRADLGKVLAPQALAARSAYRSSINEAKQKYDHISESGEKILLWEGARARNDKNDQIALMESLMQDVNFNELLKSKGYDQNVIGMTKFLNNEENAFGNKNGWDVKLDPDERLKVQNDLSQIAEKTGQWEFAKTVGVNNAGERYGLVRKEVQDDGTVAWNDKEHVEAAATDALKNDPQKILNSSSRFALGGENMKGEFELSNLGRVIVKALNDRNVFHDQKSRIRPEIAYALSSKAVMQELQDLIKISSDTRDAIKGGTSLNKSGKSAVELFNELLRSGAIKY